MTFFIVIFIFPSYKNFSFRIEQSNFLDFFNFFNFLEKKRCLPILFNGDIIRFKNRYWTCKNKRQVEVKISESKNNPDKLLFWYAKDKCSFFEWWRLCTDDFVGKNNRGEYISKMLKKYNDICKKIKKTKSEVESVKRIHIILVVFTAIYV